MTEERANRKKSRFNVFRRRNNDDVEARFEGKTIEATASERPLFQGQEFQSEGRQSSQRETPPIQSNTVGNSPEDRPSHQDTSERNGLVRALLGRGQKRNEVKETQSARPVFAQRPSAQSSSSRITNQEAQRVEEGDDVRFVSRGSSPANNGQPSSEDLPQMPPLRRMPEQQAQRTDSRAVNPSRTQSAPETTNGPMFTQRTKRTEAGQGPEGTRSTASASNRVPVSTPRQPIEPAKMGGGQKDSGQQGTGQSLFRSQSQANAVQSNTNQAPNSDKLSQSAAKSTDRPAFTTRPADQTPVTPPQAAAPRPTPLPRPEPGSNTGTRIPAKSGEPAKPEPSGSSVTNMSSQERPAVPTSSPQQATAPKDSTAPKPPATSDTKAETQQTSAKAETLSTAESRPRIKPPMPPKKPVAPTPQPAQTSASNLQDGDNNSLEQNSMSDLPNPAAATKLTPPSRLSPSGSVSLGIADQGQLIVGKDIELNGKVQNCDVLIIEGTVEATLVNTKILEVAEGGVFRGTAPVETAEISGLVEGDLIVDGHVLVRATGVVNGNIEFGELEIERGGRVHGSMLQFGTAEQKAAEQKKDGASRAPKRKAASKTSK